MQVQQYSVPAMSVRFGKQSLEVVAIRRAIDYSTTTRRVRTSRHPGTGNDRMIAYILSKIPLLARSATNDAAIYRCIDAINRSYTENHIFNGRLPLNLLVHRIAARAVPAYEPYTARLLKHNMDLQRYNEVWLRVCGAIAIVSPSPTTDHEASPPPLEQVQPAPQQ
jgi:hypothetical protein